MPVDHGDLEGTRLKKQELAYGAFAMVLAIFFFAMGSTSFGVIMVVVVIAYFGILSYFGGKAVTVGPSTPGPVASQPAAAPDRRFCGSCGAPLDGTSRFCGSCGAPAQ